LVERGAAAATRRAALFGAALNAPLALMEYWNNPVIRSGVVEFPAGLFFGLWLIAALFYLAAAPTVRGLRTGRHGLAWLMSAAVMVALALAWLGVVSDQMPCFLGGVPGCD
jgi:hypothetical protein